MTATQVFLYVIIPLIAVVIVVLAVLAMRRRALRTRFGPEYDRAVADNDSRSVAERELRDRERRHAELELRPLDQTSRARYAEQWRDVQSMFVTDPEAAVVDGDALVTRLVAERGYPTSDFDDQLAYLSVEHARVLGHFRDAHEIYLRAQRQEASTEQLRQALVHYRELVAELLNEAPSAIVDGQLGNSAATTSAPRTTTQTEERDHA